MEYFRIMKKKISLKYLLLPLLLLSSGMNLRSQVLLESVAAIVGNEVIYLSDLENTVADLRRSDPRQSSDRLRCQVFNDMLTSKLFLDQARIDSIIVTPDVIEGQLNMQINDAIRRAGSQEALESYFKKSMIEIKRDIRKNMLEQETVGEVQGTIATGYYSYPECP
jgi:peptidyl-prolyl cis-trans isomerase SurA